MQLGMIGLGRMGANMVSRLLRGGHQCVVFDLRTAPMRTLVNEGAVGAFSVDEFVKKLTLLRAFPNYTAERWGPKEADELLQADGRQWRDLGNRTN